jgi:hypothetical protein
VITATGGQNGGGIRVGAATVVSNTIVANDGREGGGITCSLGSTIKGNIVAFNCSGIYNDSEDPALTIDFNCLYGNRFYNQRYVTYGQGNIFADPKLAGIDDTTVQALYSLSDMHIQNDSPCKDAITDTTLRDTLDIDGQPRNADTYADIGADESDGSTYIRVHPIYYVDATTGSDNNDGSDWTNALASLQVAIDKAAETGGDVWVKGSQTFHTSPIIYNERITLRPFVYLVTSFDGTETSRPNWLHWPATYTSAIHMPESLSPSSVVTIRGGYRTNLIDCFTIKGGGDLYTTESINGGGILCLNASPAIRNNAITSNWVKGYGGGIYCYYGSPEIVANRIGLASDDKNESVSGGGGIKTQNSIADISRNYMHYNGSNTDGGGIHIDAAVAYEAVRLVNNCIFTNRTVYKGAGIYTFGSGSQPDALIIAFNNMVGNISQGGSGAHEVGGIYVEQPDQITIINNIIYANYGGLIYFGSSTIEVFSQLRIPEYSVWRGLFREYSAQHRHQCKSEIKPMLYSY